MTLDHRFITSKKAFELLYKKLSSTTFPVKKKYTRGRWTLDQSEFGIMERRGVSVIMKMGLGDSM